MSLTVTTRHTRINRCDIVTFMTSYALQHIYDQCIIVDGRA